MSALNLFLGIVVTAGTAAIFYIGWRENWLAHREGAIALLVATYLMWTTAFPLPTTPQMRTIITLIVLISAAIMFTWKDDLAGAFHFDKGVTDEEDVEYVPVNTDNDPAVRWVHRPDSN